MTDETDETDPRRQSALSLGTEYASLGTSATTRRAFHSSEPWPNPRLLTVAGRELLADADLVVHAGSLVNSELLDEYCADAERVRVGKDLEELIPLMADAYEAGRQSSVFTAATRRSTARRSNRWTRSNTRACRRTSSPASPLPSPPARRCEPS